MKAVHITGQGGPEVLKIEEVAEPNPGPSDVLIEVKATAINRADVLQCLGVYPAPPGAPADIPGLEYSGLVAAVGRNVQRWRPGDRAMGLVGGGAFAERLVAHERECVPVPPALDFAPAAAIPEAFFTAFDALVLQGALRSGEGLLIHAVASGVGTAAVQLGVALAAKTLGTSRSQSKLARCVKELGLEHAIFVGGESPRFEREVRAATGGRGADLVLDLVGGTYFAETLGCLAQRGRVLLVGLLAGAEASVDLRTILSKRATVVGTVLRSRPIEEKIALAQAFERQMMPLFQSGRLRPVLDVALPMGRVQEGFERMLSNETFGKVVLQW